MTRVNWIEVHNLRLKIAIFKMITLAPEGWQEDLGGVESHHAGGGGEVEGGGGRYEHPEGEEDAQSSDLG
jgi:hypothetical protein